MKSSTKELVVFLNEVYADVAETYTIYSSVIPKDFPARFTEFAYRMETINFFFARNNSARIQLELDGVIDLLDYFKKTAIELDSK